MTDEITVSILSTLLDLYPQPTLAVDPDGNFLGCNKIAQTHYSILTLDGEQKNNIFAYLHQNSQQDLREVFTEVRQSGIIGKRTLSFACSRLKDPLITIAVSHWRFFTREGFSLILQDDTKTGQGTDYSHQLTIDFLKEPMEKVAQIIEQQDLIMAIMQAQEEERKRLAENLHNSVGQLLYGAKMKTNSFQKKVHQLPEAQKLALEIGKLMDEAIQETKSIAFELLPSILQDFGLKVAIEELMRRVVPAGLVSELQLLIGDKRYAVILEIAAYRIVQELVNNVIRHAKASRLRISVAEQENTLSIRIEDNGIGYEPELLTGISTGMGLLTIQNRVRALEGKLLVHSEKNKGTITTVVLPLPAE